MDSERDSQEPSPREAARQRRARKKKRAASAEPAAERPKTSTKKKKRASAAAAPPPAPASAFGANHVALALVAGLALGGIGGYSFGKKQGGSAAKDVAAAQQRSGSAEASERVYVPLAGWSPRKGPEHAKVTIVDFSDFQ